jgi:hypothetical protein
VIDTQLGRQRHIGSTVAGISHGEWLHNQVRDRIIERRLGASSGIVGWIMLSIPEFLSTEHATDPQFFLGPFVNSSKVREFKRGLKWLSTIHQ